MYHPDALLSATWQLAREHFGPAAVEVETLATAVASTSRTYNLDREHLLSLQGQDSALLARLCFFLPRDLPKAFPILTELHRRDALPSSRDLKILDLGSGLGTTSLGVSFFAAEHGLADSIDLTVMESDRAAVDLHRRLLTHLDDRLPNIQMTAPQGTLPQIPGGILRQKYDYILLGLSLNELGLSTERAADWLSRLVAALRPGGVLLVIEPALKTVARELQRVRDAFLEMKAGQVLAPCTHRETCPMLKNERDWCHREIPLSLDGPLAEVAASAGLRDRKLTFAYLALAAASPTATPELDIWRLVSGLHATKGKVEAWLCGSGQLHRVMRLDRHLSDANETLDTVSRGALLRVKGEPVKGRLRVGPEDRVEELASAAIDEPH